MTTGLKRYYGNDHLHFVTCSCYHRQPWLASAHRRDLFLQILEAARASSLRGGRIRGDAGSYSLADQRTGAWHTFDGHAGCEAAFRAPRVAPETRRSAQAELWSDEPHVWQPRFYDFNVWSERKRIEKLRYLHRNPVKRGLVLEPEQWEWSSHST